MLFLQCGENVAKCSLDKTCRGDTLVKGFSPQFSFPTKINVPYDPLLLFICLAFEKRF